MVALSVKEEIFLVLSLSGKVSPWQYKDIMHSGKLTGPLSKVQMEEVFQQGENWLLYNILKMCTPHLVLGQSAS